MATSKRLLTGAKATGVFSAATISSEYTTHTFQLLPNKTSGFTGTIVIQGSSTGAADSDFEDRITIQVTSGRTDNFTLSHTSSDIAVRAKITSYTSGSVYLTLLGSTATPTGAYNDDAANATIYVTTQLLVYGTGNAFTIDSSAITATYTSSSITTDNITYSSTTTTLTDYLDEKQDIISGSDTTAITATSADVNILAGLATDGLTTDVLSSLIGLTVEADEINHLTGLTEDVATSLTTLETSISSSTISGLTASGDDVNLLDGASDGTGDYATSGEITTEAISYLANVTSDIQTQLDAKRDTETEIGVAEIASAVITITELNYLSGVTSNIQDQFDDIGTGYLSLAGGTMTGDILLADGTAAAPSLSFSTSSDTGMYLDDPTIMFSVGGNVVAGFGESYSIIGDGATTGAPLLRYEGVTSDEPGYSFYGDADTGMYLEGTNNIGIAAGGTTFLDIDAEDNEVELGGAASVNAAVSITGIFAGEHQVGDTVTIDASTTGTTGTTAIYTVPTGRALYVTRILVAIEDAAGSTAPADGMVMNIGTSSATGMYLDGSNNTTVFTASPHFSTGGHFMVLGQGGTTFSAIASDSGADYAMAAAGDEIIATLYSVSSEATTFNLLVTVFGYELAI